MFFAIDYDLAQQDDPFVDLATIGYLFCQIKEHSEANLKDNPLSKATLLNLYDTVKEKQFISNYLQRKPTTDEWKRYKLQQSLAELFYTFEDLSHIAGASWQVMPTINGNMLQKKLRVAQALINKVTKDYTSRSKTPSSAIAS